MAYMWTSEDKFQELVLFIHCVDSRIKIKSSVLVASTFTHQAILLSQDLSILSYY